MESKWLVNSYLSNVEVRHLQVYKKDIRTFLRHISRHLLHFEWNHTPHDTTDDTLSISWLVQHLNEGKIVRETNFKRITSYTHTLLIYINMKNSVYLHSYPHITGIHQGNDRGHIRNSYWTKSSSHRDCYCHTFGR